MPDKKLPHNLEAEQGLLGALLIDNRSFVRLPANFSANAFFSPAHARIYEAIRSKIAAGEVANPITLGGYFDSEESLSHVGGGRYLRDLAAAVITVVNTGDYAKTVVELALRRDTIAACETALKAAYAPDLSWTVDKAVGELRGALDTAESAWAGEKKRSGLPLIFADDVEPNLVSTDFVEDWLCDSEFSVIYGESNCGKTFFTLDLALHVACGFAWRGKRVERGGVIYCALEGGKGTTNRVSAWKAHHGVQSGIDLAIIPSSLNLLEDDNIDSLVASVNEAVSRRISKVRLIVIDTLSRALSGGDENSSQDMGRLVIAADRIRAVTGAHICFIHHSGKDSARGARGHSNLRAAVETEIEIKKDESGDFAVATAVKQRELEGLLSVAFRLEPIVLGQNFRGKDITTCIVADWEVGESVSGGRSVSDSLPPAQRFLFDAIVEAVAAHSFVRVVDGVERTVVDRQCVLNEMVKRGDRDWADLEAFKRTTSSIHKSLKDRGLIGFDRNYCWLY